MHDDTQNVVALVRSNGEKYVFMYPDGDENRKAALRCLGRFASNPDLSFSWYDAAALSLKIRQMKGS